MVLEENNELYRSMCSCELITLTFNTDIISLICFLMLDKRIHIEARTIFCKQIHKIRLNI